VIDVPAALLAVGFANDRAGIHTTRTIMLAELGELLAVCPPSSSLADYRTAVVDENALLKPTGTTRESTFRWLRALYVLDPTVVLFRALRDLWDADAEARPLLTLLLAAAREPLLRATAPAILAAPRETVVEPAVLADAVNAAFPERYNARTLQNIGKNAASSWTQAGYLQGRTPKVRVRAESRPPAVAYALLLGYLMGGRGEALFGTFWADLLDAPRYALHEQAAQAGRGGWIDYRRAGDVTDVEFRHLLRNTKVGA
jgi:hypothetical protein